MILSIYLVISGTLCFFHWANSQLQPQPLLLISLDGFRWDFASKAHTPYLDFLKKTGVTVPYVRSVFPTVTYPAHYSIVTGLYPESHGIVGNTMYDPDLKARFGGATTDPRWWDGAEPIWVTNQRYNGRSAVLYWPGYNVKIKGMYPYYQETSPSSNIDTGNKTGRVVSFERRVEKMMSWLTGPNPPNFVAVYFEEPDHICHSVGWDGIPKTIQQIDRVIGLIVEGLKYHGLLNTVNIIITADHGMANTSWNKVVDLDKHVDPNAYDFWDSWFNMLLAPKVGKVDYVYNGLKNVPHLHVYHKNDVPKDLHFRNNRRISPLVLVPSECWSLSSKKGRYLGRSNRWAKLSHGFSCNCQTMSTVFIAHGPAFKVNYMGRPFELVNLYPLMCKLLGIQPLPNNGTVAATADLLAPQNSFYYFK